MKFPILSMLEIKQLFNHLIIKQSEIELNKRKKNGCPDPFFCIGLCVIL